jgi:ribonuclease T2
MRRRLKPLSNPAGIPAVLLAGTLAAGAASAAPPFDYWLLALTWTPSWCATEGSPNDTQCDPDRDLGFTLHGLWPQLERGWPDDCRSRHADATRRETAAMADIMGSDGLAWYEWKKHGRCSDLSAAGYFALSRQAYAQLRLPEPAAGHTSAADLQQAFLALNPDLSADSLIVTCRASRVHEVRLCLDPELAPRRCGEDVLRDACSSPGPLDMPPVP